MTPQSTFTIIAPVPRERIEELRSFLKTMNRTGIPGSADPANALVPFGKFDTLHFARFVILEEHTFGDLEPFGPEAAFPNAPVYLAFFGDCDGSASMLLADFADLTGAGLRKIFAFCEGFDPNCDLLQWMRAHSVKPSATYFNCLGRTVRQIHEEAALHAALHSYLGQYLCEEQRNTDKAPKRLEDSPQKLRASLIRDVKEKGPILTAPAPTPAGWFLCHRLPYHLAAVLAVILVLLPLVTLSLGGALKVYAVDLLIIAAALIFFFVHLRRHETEDPEILTPVTNAHLQALGEIDDYDVTNQYSVMGSFKPGLFARCTTAVFWWVLDVFSPLLYPCGNLARIKTIHSARWVFLDGKRRALFASNYDGSDEAYMDDFVNKVAFGLNLAFSQGAPYPRTHFLLWEGAHREQEFKNTQTRLSLPTEVWYKAYPGLNLVDIARNVRIRRGLEREAMTDGEIRRWLSEI